MNRQLNRLSLSLFLLGALLLTGCGRHQAQGNATVPPPEVLVSVPVTREITDYEDFPGRTEAVSSINVRARVTGYLDKDNFKEGADVKQGDLLFEIDPRPYEAELARAQATLVQTEAHLTRLKADFERAAGLVAKRAIGREEYDKIAGDLAEAAAAVGVATASRNLAQLNLNFTKVRSPISGRISRRFIDPGNLVKADDSILTTIVSLDPMYAYFDVDERATLRLQDLIRAGKLDFAPEAKRPVLMGMANEEGYSHEGTITFADNRVDPDTGTWRLRGLFANPHHGLSSGLFVRIRLPIGEPYKPLMIAEQALGADQGQRFVYVVDANQVASYRRVKVGRLHDGMRVVTDGLKRDEQIVVSGLQRVRPGSKVDPKLVPMLEATAHSADGASGKPG